MVKSDEPVWTLVGGLVGMVTSAMANPALTLIGFLLGGFLGYLFGRSIK